jgi:light-regulated signal transduction histidine kinase (bacteriophytochrome)
MFAEEILPVAVRDGTWTGECAFLNIKDRHEIPVLMVLSSYKAPNGEVEVFSTISRDITERKKIEGQLKNYSIELEKSNKELDDFTYIISHDLKEPLRSIDAFSGFVLDDYKDKLDAEGKNYLERIRVNANRMQELIEDLLDISRIERMRNPFEEIETRELVNEVKLRLEYAIKEKNLELIVPDNLPKIFCDRVRLTEVFANLVSNAIKFNDKPKPVIEIGCSEKDGFYEFYVKDNGPGIEEQYFEKIFEIFQRLGHRETAEGTGAGLTIVKKIVQMHKGKVWVESKVGEGTTFYFTIPLKAELIQGTVTKESFFTKEEVQKITDKG